MEVELYHALSPVALSEVFCEGVISNIGRSCPFRFRSPALYCIRGQFWQQHAFVTGKAGTVQTDIGTSEAAPSGGIAISGKPTW
jgi:hypothetical protein